MNISGLYIHIPFCESKCHYCDFYSETSLVKKNELVNAIAREINDESDFLNDVKPPLFSVYFGGGTPSLLNEDDLKKIFGSISRSYYVSECEEITIEANPDDLTPEYIRMLRKFPFNRISIGVQSFNDDELKAINRRHSAKQAEQAVLDCYEAGFRNISIDLMYGLPGQTLDSFKKSVDKALDLPVSHLSSYALSWEEGSVLYKKLISGELKQASDEFMEECYYLLNSSLKAKGFNRYELSNFSLPGFESKHNSSYWDGSWYLGVGPSAHSYNGIERRSNVSSIDAYISGIMNDNPVREVELLDNETQYNDFIMTRLRTSKGIIMHELEWLFGISKRYYCMFNAKRNLKKGLLIYENGRLKLTEKALFIADSICSDLIWV